ncbi:hypothetical protein EG349_08560 [Chryseobacterium shandongense]|uniref:Uncharacterized protein n=1 Tax=Chryseobacterium shandongense TaxID=1493872 RepID=A0AAD0YCI1_9FLAO|nr:hypothetical protein [Chryseobacterium shandongense]AZA86835.1 hypothetical protein EG349_08560 [Chryseobacterium shandongense]AZA95251.1 hypothetical protein EG353_06610 [Chryseobacterium shandongense]
MKKDKILLVIIICFSYLKFNSQSLNDFVLNESLREKINNINSYLETNKRTGKIPQKYKMSYVFVDAAVNDFYILDFFIQDFYYEPKELNVRYFRIDNTYFIFSDNTRKLLNKQFNFAAIENNKIIKPSNFIIKDKYGTEETRGQLSFKSCGEIFYLIHIYIPLSQIYLKKEFNLKYPDK